jgi:hypothetical protein
MRMRRRGFVAPWWSWSLLDVWPGQINPRWAMLRRGTAEAALKGIAGLCPLPCL